MQIKYLIVQKKFSHLPKLVISSLICRKSGPQQTSEFQILGARYCLWRH